MGQKPSKRISSTSTASSTALLKRSPSAADATALESSPISDITPPRRPQPIHRLSEIIDPRTLFASDAGGSHVPGSPASPAMSSPQSPTSGLVQSPSGNLLATEDFLNHPNRPLAMWERRERVLSATREGFERFEMESRAGIRKEEESKGSRWGKRGRGCCFGFC